MPFGLFIIHFSPMSDHGMGQITLFKIVWDRVVLLPLLQIKL